MSTADTYPVRTPLTGQPLEQPETWPLRRFAQFGADQPCLEHQVAYTGRIPCTGVLRCFLCGTEWDPDSGALLGRTYEERCAAHGRQACTPDDHRGHALAECPLWLASAS